MIAICTGKEKLNEYLHINIPNTQIVNYREFLIDNKFDIVIISSHLIGDIPFEKLFFILKQNGSRIIYLTDETIKEEHKYISLCLKYGIYDIYLGEITAENIANLINSPKGLQNEDVQELFVKYVNREDLEERKVALKDLLKTKLPKKQGEDINKEIQYVDKIIEKVVEVEKIVEKEKIIYERPKDYKKLIGITGVSNTGKTLLSLYVSSILSQSKKVALVDMTENKNLKYYFCDNDISNNKYISLNKNLSLYIYMILYKLT